MGLGKVHLKQSGASRERLTLVKHEIAGIQMEDFGAKHRWPTLEMANDHHLEGGWCWVHISGIC